MGNSSWTATVSEISLTLASSESASFTVAVTSAGEAVHPDDDTLTVSATCQGNTNMTESVNLTTSKQEAVNPPNPVIYLPIIIRP